MAAVLNKAEELDTFLSDSQSLMVLFFAANWSDESKLMNDVVNELINDEKVKKAQVKFIKIEAEEFEKISLDYSVETVPTFVFIKNRSVLHKLSGADAAALRQKISELTKSSVSKAEATSSNNAETNLNERLKKLINQTPVTLFMKGTPQEPRCGFSKQIVEILKNENATFSYFDILSDNEVREGLKKYSNWPTYPQLYIKGELVGGLDIVKEMVQSGEFKTMLPKKDLELNERLKALINRSKVMLFMKGNPKEPRCGFSRQLIEIINDTGVKYEYFDILSDEEIRQGLKEYSKWPTYPQVYVNGELVGGLDIIKELKQSGELESTLKA